MAEREKLREYVGVEDLVELIGFPPLGELKWEGIKPDRDLYNSLVRRIAASYLRTVNLELETVNRDLFRVSPTPGYEWADAAYWLGNLANLRAGREVVLTPEDLRRYKPPRGEGAWPGLKEAVLGNLDLLSETARMSPGGDPGDALRRALEYALEAVKYRTATA